MKWVLFLLLLLSVSLAASPYLVIDLDKTGLSMDSGEQKSLVASIRNPNDADITVTIALLGEINTWGTIDESELDIAAGEIESTIVYVGSPQTAAAGVYGITISASGKIGEESVSKSKTFSVRVNRDEDFYMKLKKDYTVIDPGDTLSLTISLRNDGNVNEDTKLITKIDETLIDERTVDLPPLSSQSLTIPFEIPNTLPPGERTISASIVTDDREFISKEQTLTINTLSKVSEEESDEKEFWHREITHSFKNEGNIRETKEVSIELSRLEQAFMTSSPSPTSKEGNIIKWQVVLLPNEEVTISILTYGSVLYISYILVLVIILLASYLTYTKVINKPPILLEKNIVGMSRKDETKNEIAVGLYIKNTSSKTLTDVTLTDSVSSFFDVKKFESISPDRVNEREGFMEYVWVFKEMKPHEERAIVYHMEGRGPVVMKTANIRFQAGNKTYFKKTGKVAVTG